MLGGEQSGHIVFGLDNTTGDGILSSVKLLQIIGQAQICLTLHYSFLQLLQMRRTALVVNIHTIWRTGNGCHGSANSDAELHGRGGDFRIA